MTSPGVLSQTLVDEWVRSGMTAAFVAAGTEASALGVALRDRRALAVHVFDDARSASFAALGHGLRSWAPGLVVCSGDDAASVAAAVNAADRSAVPLLVVTIGRVGTDVAPFRFRSAISDRVPPSTWRSRTSRPVLEALGWSGRPGPAHLEVHVGPNDNTHGDVPPGRSGGAAWHRAPLHPPAMLGDPPSLSGRVGVIIAGRGTQTPNAVLSLADALGWPVLADYQSGCRAPGTIRHFDALFRTPAFRAVARPEVVLTFGEPPTSEPLAEWLSGLDAELVAVVPHRQWPDHDADLLINDDKAVLSLLAAVEGPPARQVDHWRWVDAVADDAIESMLEEAAELPAPAVAREIVGGIAPGSALVIGSAAQIDDVESYGPHRDDIEVHTVAECATATALGVASTGIATTLLVDGDALSSEPTPLRRIGARDVDLTIVVVAPRSWSLPEIEAGASNGVAVHRWGQTTESQEAGPEASVRLVVAEADAHEGQQSRGRLDSAVIQAVTAALESAEG